MFAVEVSVSEDSNGDLALLEMEPYWFEPVGRRLTTRQMIGLSR